MDFFGRLTRGQNGANCTILPHDGMVQCSTGQFYVAYVSKSPGRSSLRVRGDVLLHESGLVIGLLARYLVINGERVLVDVRAAKKLATAYLRWEQDLWACIEGAYSIVIWDPNRGRLSCGRDPMGSIPLYYAVSEDQDVSFGDHAGQLGQQCGLMSDLDHDWIVSRICVLPSEPGSTCLRNVRSVPPGCVVEFTELGGTTRRHWQPRELPARSTSEWIDMFRQRLWTRVSQAVDCDQNSAVALSGGLDSSSIVRIADSIAPGRVTAITYRVEGDSASNELSFARAALRGTAVPLIVQNEITQFELSRLLREAPEPDSIDSLAPFASVAECARQNNCAIVLTGTLGDIIGGYARGFETESARQRVWKELCKVEGNSQLLTHVPFNVVRLACSWATARFPAALETVERIRLGGGQVPVRMSILNADIRRAFEIRHLEHLRCWQDSNVPFVAALWMFVQGVASALRRSDISVEKLTGVPVCDPFADPILFNIAGSIPSELRRGVYRNRVLLRSAVTGLLPDAVRLRTSKSTYNTLYGRLFRQVLDAPETQAAGRVLEPLLAHSWEITRKSAFAASAPVLSSTCKLALIGAWLRAHGL